jgi:anaerobic selenocysteine-containing dehydrogenase
MWAHPEEGSTHIKVFQRSFTPGPGKYNGVPLGDQKAEKIVDMKSGKVGALLVYDCNPVYSHASGAAFAQALKSLPVTVSMSGTMDETTELCKFIVVAHELLGTHRGVIARVKNKNNCFPLVRR